ncbi:thioredoxin [bacterium]|nr:thioredoxin [bacterium]
MYGSFSDAYPDPNATIPNPAAAARPLNPAIRPRESSVVRQPQPPPSEPPAEKPQDSYVLDIQSGDFSGALSTYRVVVVKAWAKWCAPCKHLGQKMETLAYSLADYTRNKHVLCLADDIDHPSSIHREKVDVVPTVFVYHQGRLESVYTGLDYDQFLHKLKALLDHPVPTAAP